MKQDNTVSLSSESLSTACTAFRKRYPSINSGDLQSFILGFQACEQHYADIVKSHGELLEMVLNLKNCIKRLTQDDVTQFERDTEAQWEGEAHDLLIRINPNYYKNANEKQ